MNILGDSDDGDGPPDVGDPRKLASPAWWGGGPMDFAAAFETHRSRLWRLVHFRMDRRIQARVDPDDVVQEVFLAAQSRWSPQRAAGFPSFFLWLRVVALQTLSKLHRFHLGTSARSVDQEQRSGLVSGMPDTSMSLSYHLLAQVTSPSQACARDELARQLHAALEQMSATDREIIALRHFEELSNQEAASLLDLQPKAASIRYVRALQRLQSILAQFGG